MSSAPFFRGPETEMLEPIEILANGDAIALTFSGNERRRFHAIWLRDNAPDDATRAPGNGQKLITLRDIPGDIHISAARREGDRLFLTFQPENRTIAYDVHWLSDHAYDKAEAHAAGWTGAAIETWDAGLGERIPLADFGAVSRSEAALGVWLHGVRRYGFGKLAGGPVESGALLKVASLFGYVRETNYGRHFEVRTEVNPSNLAFTGLGLQAHTDNPYRDPVPTLQILYCLENSAAGGENMVVDGFRAAERLRAKSPRGFDLLTRYCARFEYAGSAGVRSVFALNRPHLLQDLIDLRCGEHVLVRQQEARALVRDRLLQIRHDFGLVGIVLERCLGPLQIRLQAFKSRLFEMEGVSVEIDDDDGVHAQRPNWLIVVFRYAQ